MDYPSVESRNVGIFIMELHVILIHGWVKSPLHTYHHANYRLFELIELVTLAQMIIEKST